MAKVEPANSLRYDKLPRCRTVSPVAAPPLRAMRRAVLFLGLLEPEEMMLPSKPSDETCLRLDETTRVRVEAERSIRNAMGPDYGDTNRYCS